MAFPRQKFNLPPRLQGDQSASRADIFEPVLGFDQSQPVIDLKPGQTPDSENFIVEDGFLTPRSGLSIFGPSDTSLGDVALMVAEHRDVDGNRFPVIASARTIAFFANNDWSTISYVVRGAGAPANQLSGTSLNNMFATSIYEPNIDQNWLVFSNGIDLPKVWQPSQVTYSDLSDYISVESIGRIPFSLDNRLCFFNCGNSSTAFATRVRWSERGLTSNFSTIGAGFEDLMDMAGTGSGVATREFDAILFSTEEVWIARPRRDAFAFSFIPLQRSLGCPFPKTIAKTPQGVIFLTRELEPYIVSGSQVRPIGKSVHQFLRTTIQAPDQAFGLYNSRRQRYELYFRTVGEVSRAAHGLYLDMDSGAWMPISFHAFEFGAGAEVGADLGGDITWDGVTMTWDEIQSSWNNMVESTSLDKEVMLVSSAGTAYRLRENQLTDDGSTITSRWDSHAFNSPNDPTMRQSISDVWADYKSDSASSMSILFKASPSDNFAASQSVDLPLALNNKSVQIPFFITGSHPQMRVQVNNATRPRLSRFVVKLRDSGQY